MRLYIILWHFDWVDIVAYEQKAAPPYYVFLEAVQTISFSFIVDTTRSLKFSLFFPVSLIILTKFTQLSQNLEPILWYPGVIHGVETLA